MGALFRAIARLLLRLAGWKTEGALPDASKYVLIAAPHTTNWDFVLMMLCGMEMGFMPRWVGKRSLFWPPMGWLLRRLGGIAIDRTGKLDLVARLAALFQDTDRLILAMPPEGTRGYSPHWRSGFYWVARTANVPICLGYLDYARRRGGLGRLLVPSGDVHADMDVIRAFYADKKGLYPANQGPIRLEREENPPQS